MEPISSKPSSSIPSSHTQENPRISVNPTNTGDKSKSRDPSESVSLSQTGQEISHYTETMANLPNIRQEKITNIQAAIKQGSYNVSAEDLADKIIQHISNHTPSDPSSST